MENEIMNYEEEVMEPEAEAFEVETEESEGGNPALFMLIGAGLTIATTAVVKWGKNQWEKYKAKKELRKPDEDEPVEVTEAQIMDVTK